MKPRLLVVSPLHPPDDPRIRHKLIGTLESNWTITFAGRGRGPVDQTGMKWLELRGGRIMRDIRAGRLLLKRNYEVASLHDPEMLPAAILASFFGRTIVFDVHENIPGQIRTKEWLPKSLRKPLAWMVNRILRIAERRLEITLAETGYRDLFVGEHPVFPNYLVGDPPPPCDPDPAVGVVYLGDVTQPRGLALAVESVAAAGARAMTIMGRCKPDFRWRLLEIAEQRSMQLEFRGFVEPSEALEVAARGQLGLSPLLDTPNYRASLPTKILEYLAVGIPTLASDLPGTRSVVADKAGVILVEPGNVTAWEAAVRRAIHDEGLRAAAANGATAIKQEYVWPADAVRAFYWELLD